MRWLMITSILFMSCTVYRPVHYNTATNTEMVSLVSKLGAKAIMPNVVPRTWSIADTSLDSWMVYGWPKVKERIAMTNMIDHRWMVRNAIIEIRKGWPKRRPPLAIGLVKLPKRTLIAVYYDDPKTIRLPFTGWMFYEYKLIFSHFDTSFSFRKRTLYQLRSVDLKEIESVDFSIGL